MIRTLGQRHRDEESGLQTQRQAVRMQFTRVYVTREWVAGLPRSIDVTDPSERQQIQDEAIRHGNECRAVWNIARTDIDSDEVRSAMARLDQDVEAALGQVAKGNFAPDLDLLRQSLDALTAAAKHRLSTDLGPRPARLTGLRRSGEARGRHEPR